MTNEELKNIWLEKFKTVPQSLQNMRTVKAVATAFNTNVDAVLKIKSNKIAELAKQLGLSLADLQNITRTKLETADDVIKGLFRCFIRSAPQK